MTSAHWESRLRDNLAAVRERMAAACARARRAPAEVRLVAVTKYAGPAVIRALLAAGVRELGESRVQVLSARVALLGSGAAPLDAAPMDEAPRWHFIGHLQRNKVKYLLPRVRLVHSLDSVELAAELDRHAQRHEVRVEALLEVNVAGEASKFGLTPAQAPALLDLLAEFPRVRVCGLMTMAPLVGDAEASRPHFAALRALLTELHARGSLPQESRHLSMGMTQDYPVAIEEGATLVRVGSALFDGLPAEALSAA
jgi:hypothetical protein